MDLELPHFCRLLKDRSSDEINGPHECQRLLNTLNHNLTEEQLSSSTIDSYLAYLFDKHYGLLDFVLDLGARKEFIFSSTKCLEIIYTLANNFPRKFSQYIVTVIAKCLKIIQTNVAAKVKVRAYDVLLVSFEKIDMCPEYRDSYLKVFESVKDAVKLDHPDTVRQREYLTIGLFVKRFPYLVVEPHLIKNYLVRQLDNEMAKKGSAGKICAILTALTYFCEGFPLDASDKSLVEKLYIHIRCLSVPKSGVKVGNRAALGFLKSNMPMFINLMLSKYNIWHKHLLTWLELGAEDAKTGEAALKAYLIAVAEYCKDAGVLLHFVRWMRHVLEKDRASAAEKRLVLSGLKVFSGPLHQYLPPHEATRTFLLIRHNFEAAYVVRCDADDEDWEYLPDYIQCVAGFIRFQKFSPSDICCLQRAIVNLFKTYPKLKSVHQALAAEALATTLFYLRKTDHFESFLESTIYQGVIWSCSHQHATNSDAVTVKNYFPLWRALLNLTGDRSFDRYSIFLDDRKYIVLRIVDRLIKTLMALLNKLDVTLNVCEDLDATDIGAVYKARNANDYAVFLNAVDFYLEILDDIEPATLTQCVAKMIDHFIDKCRRHPLVSGFYKLLAAALKIADALSVIGRDALPTLNRFVVATAQKVKRFKDELLVACLKVLLATPTAVAESLLQHYVNAFEVAFDVAKGHTALADAALDSLERWQRAMDRDAFDDFLIQIVHYLDGYLTSKSLGSAAQSAIGQTARKTARTLKKRAVLVELEPELVKFQRRALAFVGSQTERVCRALVRPDSVQRQSRGCPARYLKVALPYDDVTLDVHLEALVARVTTLALHSTDRKTKITACEVLQAITAVLLGQTKQLTTAGLSDMKDLVKDVAESLLCLAGDADPVVRQLFEPLLLQLAHWYSSPGQADNPHAGVILDVLTEGATHPTNSSVRDFAGTAVGEFVKWTIKQTREKSLFSDPKYVRVIVRKMRFFASHPDYAKKRGAAVIFNNIYRELRGERALLNIFTIEILHIFVNGLASMRGRRDDESDDTAESINKSLSHLQRMLVERADAFRETDDARRRIPSDIAPGNLAGVAKWLLLQTASLSKYCRDASVALFVRLAPLCGFSLRDFAQTHVPDLTSLYQGCESEEAFSRFVDGYAFVMSHNVTAVDIDILVERVVRYLDRDACCAAILKLIDVLVNYAPDNALWRAEVWTLVRRALFEPHALGLEDSHGVRVVIGSLARKLPRHRLAELADALRVDADVRIDLATNASYKQSQLLKGLLLLKPYEAFGPPSKLVESVMANFYAHLEDGVIFLPKVSESAAEHCLLAFDYSLSQPEEMRTLLDHLVKPYVVNVADADRTTFGVYLLTRFGVAIMKHLPENVEMLFEVDAGMEILVQVMSLLLAHLATGELKAPRVQRVVLERWSTFRDYFDNGRAELGLEFVKKLSGAFGRSEELWHRVSDWVTGLISPDVELGFCLSVALAVVELAEGAADGDFSVLDRVGERVRCETESNLQNIVVNELLAALPFARSVPVFKFIIELYSWADIDTNLTDLLRCCVINNGAYHESLLNVTLEACLDPAKTFRQRIRLCDHVLGPVLVDSSRPAFESFVTNSIDRIVDELEGATESGRCVAHFRVAEVLFSRIPMADEKIRLRLVKQSLGAFKNPRNGSKEERRKFACAAYKALASIVSNSIKMASFYEKLFVREENGADILWSALVDVDVEYNFSIEFSSLPKQRAELVHIRDDLRRGELRPAYLESQKLFESSLSEDVTKFDFNGTILRHAGSRGDADAFVDDSRSKVILDGTEVNEHECMATVCRLIVHVFDAGVYRLPADGAAPEVPNWMEGVRSLLLKESTPKNVKIFWAKVIDNTAGVFRHFAARFVGPLMRFVVDNVAGAGMNYFVSDVMVTVAAWSSQLETTDEKQAELCSRMLSFAIRNLNNERRDVFKYHVELIKLVVENWKDRLKSRCPSLSDRLECAVTDKSAEVGIHLASVFLSNGLCHDAVELWSRLTRLLASDVSSIYKPCAETLGLLLDYVRQNLPKEEASYRDELTQTLLSPNLNIEKYAFCLEGVVIHYPAIVDHYHAVKIFNRLSQSDQDLKLILLKIVLRTVETLADLPDFRTENWRAHLECGNVSVQMVALEILAKAFQTLASGNEYQNILDALGGHGSNPNVLCRARAYDVAMLVLNHDPTLDACRKLLVRGLGDPDEDIRTKIRAFWSHSPLLPSGVREKFSALLSLFYYPDCEDRFLTDVAYFLLDSLGTDKMLFEHPLEDCVYEPYELEIDWRVQPPSLVPLFAETFQTEHSRPPSGNVDELRATRTSFSFAPTRTTLREQEITQRTGLDSSLLVGPRDQFVDPNRVRLSGDYRLPKRRFLKDKAKISAFYAHAEVTKKIGRAEKRREGVAEAEKKVTIYRKYRKGDFPDILITLDSLIGPLKMLALQDAKLSKELFSTLFKGLSAQIPSGHASSDAILDGIKRVFANSVQFNALLFSALFDILLDQKRRMPLEPDLVSAVSRQSGLLSVGSLLLEEYLADGDAEARSSKRSCREDDLETRRWVRLAELYRERQEWPSVQTIFAENTLCGDAVKAAIACESEGMYRPAQELFEQLLHDDPSPERRDFYYESLFKCMARLGSWDRITGAVESLADPLWPTLWDGDRHQQKILPWFVEAQVKNILFSETGSDSFFSDVNASLATPDQAEYLTQNFSKELSLLWLVQGDIAQASQYCRSAVAHFLNEWQLLNPLYPNVRYRKLVNLKSITEIQQFVDLASAWEQDTPEKLRRFLDLCKRGQQESLPSIVSGEEQLLHRRLFIRLLETKMAALGNRELIRELRTTKILLDIEFMDAAVADGNYFMTRKYFRNYVGVTHRRLSAILVHLNRLYAATVADSSVKLDKLLEALERIGQMTDNNAKEKLQSALDFFDISGKVTEVLEDNRELFASNEDRILSVLGTVAESPTTAAAAKLKSIVLESDIDANGPEVVNIQKALLKLAYFVKNDEQRTSDFVMFVSRAMRFGSNEARQLFPCILLKNGLASELKELFVAETREIPTWMFLAWIPQLLAADVPAVHDILTRIAEAYPQAIMYAYRLSRKGPIDRENNLDGLLLSDPVVDKFVAGLSKVKVPLVSLGDYVKKMFHCSDPADVVNVKRALQEDMFNDFADGDGRLQGRVYNSVKRFKASVEKIAAASTPEAKKKLLIEIDVKRRELLGQQENCFSTALKDYCPWLASFSAGNSDFDLEIPGQYTGEKPPLIKHHVRISMLRPNVSVMRSMRKPIKITMVGMDGKEYPFLIKFGEDVRQDQRIEQLLQQMNAIFANEHKTHEVVTYQVVPLSKRLGIIQWVENCRPLANFMLKQNKFASVATRYGKFFVSAENDMESYGRTAMEKDRNKVVPFFSGLVNEIPMDVLKKAFWSISFTTESFIAYRDNFIKSYAATSACQWLLGIGDRHLENFMVCVNTGKVVGIDFGHAFGTATQLLQVPELVPIRLTPHILALMEPLKERGALRYSMIDCLKSLRRNRESLLATMEVFVQEPSEEWLENAVLFNAPDYKTKKVDQVQRKLRGASSVDILTEDLKANRSNKYNDVYVWLVRKSGRGGSLMNVEEQVDELIRHATDYNLLGRMWQGWSPWV